jgi:hypothetical protein
LTGFTGLTGYYFPGFPDESLETEKDKEKSNRSC